MKLSNLFKSTDEKSDENKKRGNWSTKADFLLSCMGYAIGIGNVWRFPYLCYRNGGGAFLVPYLLMLFTCGIPLFFMENSLGQFSSLGCLTVFRISPLLKGAGLCVLVVNFLVSAYYNVIIAYTLYFLYMSFTSDLPWATCGNKWNTDKCVPISLERTGNVTMRTNVTGVTPTDEFFHRYILEISEGINHVDGMNWPLFGCVTLAWVLVYLCIIKGVKSVGKVVYFTATFPFLILGILFIRGITLPGAVQGILYYITPDFERLKEFKVWGDAAVQIFFSLGPGWGGLITMASYNRFHNNVQRDSILVPILNCSTSIFAGFVVFSVLGFMSAETGIDISKVAKQGPSLAFVTYPEALSLMSYSSVWAVLFFFMLFTLGLDSQFVQIETICSAIMDEWPALFKYKPLFTLAACVSMYLVSMTCVTRGGMYVLNLLDWYCASISVILVCACEIIVVCWVYGCGKFLRDLEFMIQKSVGIIWGILMSFITPVLLIGIFVTLILWNTPASYGTYQYPPWAIALGWGSCGLSAMIIPVYAIAKLCVTPGSLKQRINNTLFPGEKWRPALDEHQKEWLQYCKQNPAGRLPPLCNKKQYKYTAVDTTEPSISSSKV